MKASHLRVIKALEDGARIRDYGGLANEKTLRVNLSGKTLFYVRRSTLESMMRDPECPLITEWRL